MHVEGETSNRPDQASESGHGTAIALLLVLSPVIGEVLSGATRLSYIFALVPEILVWGAGTLLIRELVRRIEGGWTSLLLLGFGLAIAEEFVIQQTSLAPLPFLGSAPGFGRVWGVNWPYFAFMLVYEALWIVVVPVQIAELVFRDRRDRPWLRRRGVVASSVAFVVGSLIAWFTWTRQARPNVFHVPVYHPPIATVSIGLLAIALLAGAAWALRRVDRVTTVPIAPPPWMLTLAALILGFPWYLLMVVIFAPRPVAPLWVVLAGAAAWASAAYVVVRRWALAARWSDAQRWGLCFGALVVCMVAGFLGAGAWPRSDTVAKAIFDVAAVLAMIALRRSIGDADPAVTSAARPGRPSSHG